MEPDAAVLTSDAFTAELVAWQEAELRRVWPLRLRELAAMLEGLA
jgi:hypothetical protein